MTNPNKITYKQVTRKFLLDLADDIYNPRTRKFLRLCDGQLTNGPDPTNSKRKMHCGLGELYFAMTGRHTFQDSVGEDDVIDIALKCSTLASRTGTEKRRLLKQEIDATCRKLSLNDDFKFTLHQAVEDEYNDADFDEEVTRFTDILHDIPDTNDDECGNACNYDTFRSRSQRVATQLRRAAKLLP